MTSSTQHSAILAAALARLVQLCQSNFQIQLSLSQLQQNAAYRDAVLAELSELDDNPLQLLIAEIKQLILQPQAEPAAAPIVQTIAQTAVPATAEPRGNSTKLWAVAATLVLCLGAGAWFVTNGNPASISTAKAQTNTTSPQATAALIRLHGSNTVGEKLAPALLEAFLAQQGGAEFSWQQQAHANERQVSFKDDGKTQLVELHAHGSSTAFKDLLSGKADIGMSSRRISLDEVDKGMLKLGDLSKIGNEHIIALDGLAVIVNQNNSLKALSTEQLAKIFSGEVSRWSELGGADKPIVILARDDNSGTFDTFNSLVLKKFTKTLSAKARRFESSTELSVAVSQDENAIGFIGLDFISYNKALAISEGADTTPIYPTRFTISTEDYALARRLYLYTPTSSSQMAKDFAQFAISEQGQALVEQAGLISQNIKVEKTFPQDNAPASYNRYAETGQRLSLNFRFNHGENELDNKGKRDLERLIRFMEQNSGRRLVLMGFSDSTGDELVNADLAMRRAKVIETELVSRGIAVRAVESYGEMLPIANNDSDAGRERNRRVEVWVI